MTWVTSVPILVFLGSSVLDLRQMYATDRRQTKSDAHHRLMSRYPRGGGIVTGKRLKTNQKVHTASTDCNSHTFLG